MNSSWDVFKFTLSDKQNILTNQHINITVKARVKSSAPTHVTGNSLVISTDLLDAGDLADITRSDPVYRITKPPIHGELVRSKNSGRFRRATEQLDEFTHSDILDGHVTYSLRNLSKHASADNFTYLLRAKDAQPASASLQISITPRKQIPVSPVTKAPSQNGKAVTSKPKDHPTPKAIPADKGIKEAKMPPLSTTHLLVIIIVCGVTGMSIICFIGIKCYKSRHKNMYDEDDEDGYSTTSSHQAVQYPSSSEAYGSSSEHMDTSIGEHMKDQIYSRSIPTINVTTGTPDTKGEFESINRGNFEDLSV